MTTARFDWHEADRLFDAALELPAEERARWLDEHCPDPELRRHVERLLEADAAAGRFLELDGWQIAGPPASEDDAVGRLVGPYRIVRELARGGMGIVYLAERADGQFRQQVALKLIRHGIDSDRIHRRFLAERQILARLSHANIARLLDGGVSDRGEAYFAIEYVEGVAIIFHAEARALGVSDRLRLFLQVAEAVRYAHQNLVVHRDLKPGNILVTEDGQVKLLDFGIAKVVRGDGQPGAAEDGLDSLVTLTEDRLLTPEYAAPEQVRGEAVTTATDIYALGTVLYELLTGRRAHHVERRTPTEIVRAVVETIPAAPSAVARAGRRRELRGDLDVIVLTALRKEPARRYQTVEKFAGDLVRYLDGLPVSARADSWRYRAGKLVRRHRVGAAAAAAVLASLVAGLAGTVWQARVAAERARVASAEAAKQRAVGEFLVRLFARTSPAHTLGREPSASQLLDQGRRDLDTALAGQPETRAALLAAVAQAYGALGHMPQSDTLFAQAVALARTLPRDPNGTLDAALTGWAGNYLVESKFDQAAPLLREAIARSRVRDPDDPWMARPLRALGRVYTYTGQHDSAAALLREALALDLRHHGPASTETAGSYDDLGYELLKQENLAGADTALGRALAIWRARLPSDHPSILWTLSNLSALRLAQGNRREAEALLREVVAAQHRIYPRGHPELAHSLMWLGSLLAEEGRYAEAESLTAPEVDRHRSLLGPDNDHVIVMIQSLADFRYRLGKLGQAERDQREVVAGWRRTLGPEHRRTLDAEERLAVILREEGKLREASALLSDGLAVRRRVGGGRDIDVARTLLELAIVDERAGRPEDAERRLREALAIARAAKPDGVETAQIESQLGAVLDRELKRR